MLAAVVTAAAGCGGKGSAAPADAGSDTAVDAPEDIPMISCDPALQDCPAAEKCDFGCRGTATVLACTRSTDGGAIGAPCSAAAPCARGGGCMPAGDAGSQCRKYCSGDGDCPTGTHCLTISITVPCDPNGGPILNLPFCY